jgi:predicted RNA-binding Zn ribbon-like protein
MKVSTSAPPPSRAGSLDLIADDLALDFANTESGRGFPSHENHLREAEHVAQWLRHAKALPADDADWLEGEVSKRADLAADLLTQAIALREAIHDIGAALGRRAKPPAASLADLSALHARCVAKAALAPGVLSCRWRWSVRAAPVEAALGPIALAAVKSFTAAGGAKWRSAAIAPSSGGLRPGGARIEPPPGLSPRRSFGRGDARRLLAGAGDRPGQALPHGAARAHAGSGADRHCGAKT